MRIYGFILLSITVLAFFINIFEDDTNEKKAISLIGHFGFGIYIYLTLFGGN